MAGNGRKIRNKVLFTATHIKGMRAWLHIKIHQLFGLEHKKCQFKYPRSDRRGHSPLGPYYVGHTESAESHGYHHQLLSCRCRTDVPKGF